MFGELWSIGVGVDSELLVFMLNFVRGDHVFLSVDCMFKDLSPVLLTALFYTALC